MTDATQYAEEQFAGMWFSNTAPDGAIDGPAVALWTVAPSNTLDFSNEVSGGSYSRVTTTSSDWTKNQSGGPIEYQNANDIDFGVLDSNSNISVEGIVLVREDLQSPQGIYANDDVSVTVSAGDAFRISTNNASFSID